MFIYVQMFLRDSRTHIKHITCCVRSYTTSKRHSGREVLVHLAQKMYTSNVCIIKSSTFIHPLTTVFFLGKMVKNITFLIVG